MTSAFIRRLSLANFRSYHAAQIELGSAGPVVLTGANGAGKTNLIEAISLLAPGRGLRRATMEELAFSEGDGAWAVSAEIEGMLGLATLGTGIDPPAGEDSAPTRKCRVDRESVGSAAAFADHLRVVWLTPAMDPLFNGPASERRRFLDRLVLAVDAQHSSRVAALERSLRSRNRLLEEANSIAQSCYPAVKRVTRTGPAPDHKPSILQDYELGRAMEIDVLVRAPAAFARTAGLDTPMLDLMAALAIQKARDKGLYSV